RPTGPPPAPGWHRHRAEARSSHGAPSPLRAQPEPRKRRVPRSSTSFVRLPVIGAVPPVAAPPRLERNTVEDELDLIAPVEQRHRFAQVAFARLVGPD